MSVMKMLDRITKQVCDENAWNYHQVSLWWNFLTPSPSMYVMKILNMITKQGCDEILNNISNMSVMKMFDMITK